MSSQIGSPLFSKKNAFELTFSIVCFLLLLLGFFAYDSFNWYVRARNWPLQQAGLDSSGYCGTKSKTECTFIVEYTYQKQTYHEKITLPKAEYNNRIEALQPGEDSRSILVDIKINPEHPEIIFADPKIRLGVIASICILGVAILGIFLGGARLFNRV